MGGVLDLIGNTPLVEITRFDTGLCRLFVKLESHNPGGSIKDRIALGMIAAAEKSGALRPGGTIVEATAGNTGIALALVGRLKGYKTIIVMPDKMSREKALHCKALGADVRMARSDVPAGHPEHYHAIAADIARAAGGFHINQFANPANPATHEDVTAPEIWAQMGQDVDAVVVGAGSGGTLTGLGRFFGRVSPKTEMVLADPAGSILEPLINRNEKTSADSWLVEGIGLDFIPGVLDLPLAKKAYAVSDADSIGAARDLLLKEGILAGPSSGTLFAAALRYCREQKTPKRVVTLVCDRGDKYLSKTFSDFWMTEQGLARRAATGTVEDLIVRRHDCHDTVIVRDTDTLLTAYKRLRMADVSQVPVLDGAGRFVGVADDAALLSALAHGACLTGTVADIMMPPEPCLPPTARLEAAAKMLQVHARVVVTDGDALVGVITRVDLLNHLVLQAQRT